MSSRKIEKMRLRNKSINFCKIGKHKFKKEKIKTFRKINKKFSKKEIEHLLNPGNLFLKIFHSKMVIIQENKMSLDLKKLF